MSVEGELRVDDVFEPVTPCYLCGRACRKAEGIGTPSVCDGCGRAELGVPEAPLREPPRAPPRDAVRPALEAAAAKVGPRPPLDPAEELWLLELWSREDAATPRP